MCSASQTYLLMAPFSLSQVSLDSRDKYFFCETSWLRAFGKRQTQTRCINRSSNYPTESIQFTNELWNHRVGTGPWVLRTENQSKPKSGWTGGSEPCLLHQPRATPAPDVFAGAEQGTDGMELNSKGYPGKWMVRGQLQAQGASTGIPGHMPTPPWLRPKAIT